MKLEIFYIDAFTKEQFSGNPAAVIFSNLDDENLMQCFPPRNPMQ